MTAGITSGILVGTFAAIAKDELQASIPYPKVERGWSYEIKQRFDFVWMPHPFYQKLFTITTETIVRDQSSKEIRASNLVNKYRLEDLPDGLARKLASRPSKTTEIIYS